MSAAEPIRILIAEDVPTDAELSVRELKRAGLRVVHRIADTEPLFRSALADFAPQIILSDFSMPQFDGMHALALARELAPDTPFIFVSGTLGEEYAIRALKNGATDYVLKNNLIRLPTTVERALAETADRLAKREVEMALQETRERMHGIVESAADGIALCDHEGRLLTANRQFASMFGYSAQELVNQGVESLMPPDKRQGHAAHVAAFIAAPRARRMTRLPIGGLRKDGTRIDIEISLSPLHSKAGLQVICIVRDVTDQVTLQKRLARLGRIRDLLGAVNAAIVRVRERNPLLETFCRIAVELGGFHSVRLVEIERPSGLLRLAASTDQDRDSVIAVVDEYNRDRAGAQSLLAEALRSGRAAVSNDATADPRVHQRAVYARDGINALACLPFEIDGKVDGAVVLRARERGFFDDEELSLLGELSANLSFALELADKQKQLDFLAYYDPLSGLPNRMLMRHQLTQAIDAARAAGQRMALVILDIDRFKAINDALGQAAGDAVLKHVARLAIEVAGEPERVARIGGNQFALLVPAVREAGEVGRLLERMAASLLDSVIDMQGHEIRVATKAGAAIYPEDGADAETLLTNAEAAMKRAKATGERYGFYEPSLNARVAGRLDLEAKVLRAVERGEFALALQPKVELNSSRIVGMEALLRWKNGGRGPVSPGEFVPVLEDTGLILQVGQWAMRQAVATHRAWLARGLPATRIAVNVSAIQLRGRSFVDDVRAALDGDTGENCGLDLEITESLLMENIDESLGKLRELRDLGVRIALDDFGTGYSSLAYLSKLPIDTLKIDRAFILGMTENADDTAIVTAMISLARSLDLRTVAEGVETDAQKQLLKLLRCEQIQGYLFSRPLPADEAAALLAVPPAAPAVANGDR